jgi:hypothetical protein
VSGFSLVVLDSWPWRRERVSWRVLSETCLLAHSRKGTGQETGEEACREKQEAFVALPRQGGTATVLAARSSQETSKTPPEGSQGPGKASRKPSWVALCTLSGLVRFLRSRFQSRTISLFVFFEFEQEPGFPQGLRVVFRRERPAHGHVYDLPLAS